MRKFRYGDLAVVVALGIAARNCILFSTPLVPGVNGAYYLAQARSLLEKGRLGIPDFPLTFFLHAFFAKSLQLLSGVFAKTTARRRGQLLHARQQMFGVEQLESYWSRMTA